MHTHHKARLRFAAGAAFVLAFGAAADELRPRVDSASPLDVDVPTPDVRIVAIGGLGRAIATDRLSVLRGGDASQTENLADVDGSVDGNTAHHITSGSNSIADGAFGNASGINTVIQNTGSNVLIQNAMIVTVDFGAVPQ